MTKPYVVTDDISYVFSKLEKQGIIPPDAKDVQLASSTIIQSLRKIFGHVDVISSEKITGFLLDEVKNSDVPCISMTGLVEEGVGVIGSLCFSRSVVLSGKDNLGYNLFEKSDPEMCPRSAKAKSLTDQFNDVTTQCREERHVALVDDVVFSGNSIIWAAEKLKKTGIHVSKVYASIIMKEAIDNLQANGIQAIGNYVYDDVTDEVCMRDFIAGCPEGGRNVILSPQVYAAAPYIYPLGNVSGWASIKGEDALKFSRDALIASTKLWESIDKKKNGRTITVKELSKPIVNWNPEDSVSARIREASYFLMSGLNA